MRIKFLIVLLLPLFMAMNVNAELGLYVKSFDESNYLATVVVVNNGLTEEKNLQIRVDNKEWDFLIQSLQPGLGVTYTKYIPPGKHSYSLKSEAMPENKVDINLAPSTKTEGPKSNAAYTARSISEINEEIDKKKKFAEIRNNLDQAASNDSNENKWFFFESHKSNTGSKKYLILSIIASAMIAIILMIVIRCLLKRIK